MATKRNMTCAYLYSDGTLVKLLEETRNGIKIGETVDIVKHYCKSVAIAATYGARRFGEPVLPGRIVIHCRYRDRDGFTEFARGGKVVAHGFDIAAGSENSRNRGIQVQHVSLVTAKGYEFGWTDTNVISSLFTIQTGAKYETDHSKFTTGGYWGSDARIWSVKDLAPTKEVTDAVLV